MLMKLTSDFFFQCWSVFHVKLDRCKAGTIIPDVTNFQAHQRE